MPADEQPPPAFVDFVPLGGLGEIGMNCFALVSEGQILVVDSGATFPDDDLGVDVIHPDFSWLVERAADIVAVFITHGHEDHIGALPQLLSALPLSALPRRLPVYAPVHASALIASRFAERGKKIEELYTIEPGKSYHLGAFCVEPVAVAHSIIDAVALCITTKAGRVVHTADFSLDEEQPAGHLTDVRRLSELGDEGVLLLLSDSTNVDTELREGNEGTVRSALIEAVRGVEHRAVVSLFSSNVHRLAALVEAAKLTGRKLCLLGRSLRKHFEIAARLERISVPSDLLVSPSQAAELPRGEVLILASGSQGESSAALRKLSLDAYPELSLESGDTVLLSSRVIPGNERPVFRMLNDLSRRGVAVVTRQTLPGIHVSGHASRSELREMLVLVRPQAFVPVHGTLHHLNRHRELARELGVQSTAVVENGSPLRVYADGVLAPLARVKAGEVRVAEGGEVLAPVHRRRRGELGRAGVIFVSLTLTGRASETGNPRVSSLGVPGVDGDAAAFSVLVNAARRCLGEGLTDSDLTERVRRSIKTATAEMCGVRPQVEVHLHRT